MKFSEELRMETAHIWQANLNHPFVKGIGDGTLPLENFRYYVMQDAYYLSHFAKVQSLGAAKANDFETTNQMAAHAQGTYEAESALHRTFFQSLGVTAADIAVFKPAPTAYAYTSHLYRAAYEGHLGDIIAVILPCYWIYHEIGEHLQACTPEEVIYQKWIAAYGGEWFKKSVDEQINRLDEIAETVTAKDLTRMKEHFIISCKYEYAFWEMAYTLEKWPGEIAVAKGMEQ
ncbi:thiaminase II [Aquibacillus salsiterrae]|uniref:Aminopyrimidine aminohydrolase n=1 Tax=Aquibacillus salsiterrae TaxID=2950439 RepID=A0A9X3WIL1_9BACI|nr:thiaminase II [Aquibacillus salsiterrae]MDC3418054.1 thiaminase II [Aquibacillus salsiterrae]